MAVEAVHHILRVTDIERAIRFYRDGLGFVVVERPGDWWANLACPNGQLGLNAWEGNSAPGQTDLSLLVDDLDAMCEAIRGASGQVHVLHEPHPGSNVRLAEVSDTEGNRFLLAQRVR